MSPKPFAKSTVENLLVKCHRRCCICHKFCGSKMEIHHIDQKGSNDEDNGIVLCFDCHAEVLAYNDAHPKGRKYTISELKKHREQWFKLASMSPFMVHDNLGLPSSEFTKHYSTSFQVTGSTKKSGWIDYEEFEDDRVFISKENAATSRTISKRGYLSSLAYIPVFLPSFTNLDPDPHIFGSQSVYVTSRPPSLCRFDFFSKTIKTIEKLWKDGPCLSVYDTFNWSISEDKQFTFGYGGTNLISELRRHKRATFGAVLQGNFGEDYGKTFFLVIYGYHKGAVIRDFGADFYLKTIPLKWDWFQQVLTSFQNESKKIDITHFSFRELPIYCWKTRQNESKFKIIGGLRKHGQRSGDKKNQEEFDCYSGVIIENESLLSLDYELEISADSDYFKSLFQKNHNPLVNLKESIISITNPIPLIDDLKIGEINEFTTPSVTMIPFDAYGGTIFGISVHSGMGSVKLD